MCGTILLIEIRRKMAAHQPFPKIAGSIPGPMHAIAGSAGAFWLLRDGDRVLPQSKNRCAGQRWASATVNTCEQID